MIMPAHLPAQTFTVLHTFGNGTDGYEPLSGVTLDAFGNLYGTTTFGGGSGSGIAYKLTPHGSTWTYSVLHHFGGSEGALPIGKLLVGRDGSLYGTATYGGTGQGGTVFNLRPSPSRCGSVQCEWGATVLHNFYPSADGRGPEGLNFDLAGNILGAAPDGGPTGVGTVFKLTRSQNSWNFSLLTDFRGIPAGSVYGGVIADAAGDVFGAGYNTYPGTVFEITGSGQVQILHQFLGGDGLDPFYGLTMDAAGNVFGLTAFGGGRGEGGTVYELSPSGGGWTFNLVYSFRGIVNNGVIGSASLSMDAAGNLYGTTFGNGAYDYGTVFKLTPSENGWIYTDLHDFTGGADGCTPWSDVVIDSRGSLYGTASACGSAPYPPSAGTVWEIAP